MPYTHFRFIAYEVPTASQDAAGNVRSGFDPGRECDPVARIPVGEMPEGAYLITPDARTRLLRLAAVVDRAAERLAKVPSIAAEQNTLKVFMVPEFYFRPSDFYGIDYSSDTYPEWDAFFIMNQLTRMFQHQDFTDWLIIPGTILLNQQERELAPHIYNNIAMAVKGGDPATVGWTISCPKAVPSGIDGLPLPFADKGAAFLKDTYADLTYRKLRIFGVSGESVGLGVPCGIEVCLDHGLKPGVLKMTLSECAVRGVGTYPLSLHLLTAGGMTIQTRSVAARPGGYFLRNDGYSDEPHSEMRQVMKYVRSTDSSLTSFYDLGGAVEFTTAQFGRETLDLGGAERMPIAGNGWVPKFEFTQRLVFYPRCVLP